MHISVYGSSKFTDHDRTFCLQPSADVFGRCAQQRIKKTTKSVWMKTCWFIEAIAKFVSQIEGPE